MKVKNISYLSFITSICLSCGIKTQEEVKKKELATIDRVNVEESSSINCEPLEIPDNPKLERPIDLAVSNDGNTVYAVKNIIPIDKFNKVYRRNFIYKITKNNKIEILKINGIPPTSCRYGFSIEKDNNENIYINDLDDNSIYKISEKEDKIKKILQIKERPEHAAPEPIRYPENVKPPPFILGGPHNIYVNNQDIYFAMYVNEFSDTELQIKKFNNGKLETLFLTKDAIPPVFTVYKDKIFADFSQDPYDEEKTKIDSIDEITPPYIYPNYEKSGELQRLKTIKLLAENKDNKFQVDEMRVNSKGELFIADKDKNVIWKAVPAQNKISVFAGSGKAGFRDGKGENAQFNLPSRMDFDAYDNLYLADTGNNAIRKITADGTVTTFYSQSKN